MPTDSESSSRPVHHPSEPDILSSFDKTSNILPRLKN
jgi:hypothetical protein